MRRAAAASLFTVLAACAYAPLEAVPMHGIENKDLPITVNRDLDLLFLIDDSPSMADKQANLAANFPKFIQVLDTVQGGLPNVHIGVATSDLGTMGSADTAPGPTIGTIGAGGCAGVGKNGVLQLSGAPVTDVPFVSDLAQPDGTRRKNYTGNLTDVFGTMARVGAGGCGFEQHLQAVERALDPANTPNATFLRRNAYLAIIIIADEDDCSIAHSSLLEANESGPLGPRQSFRCTKFGVLCEQGGATTDAMGQVGTKAACHPNDGSAYLSNVAATAAFVKGLKADPRQVIVAGIMGPTEPFATELRVPPGTTTAIPALAHSCTYVGGDGTPEVADPAVRLQAFLDEFGDRGTFVPICQRDLSSGLQQIGGLLKSVIGDPCVEGTLIDVDPQSSGAQYECTVEVKTGATTTALPRCNPEDASATNQPCWRLVTDAAACPNSEHFLLKVEGQETLFLDAHVVASCFTTP